MIKLKRILVPTDFSDFSKPAVDYACALAARFESELHLVHVIDDPVVHVHDPTMISISTNVAPCRVSQTAGFRQPGTAGDFTSIQ